MGFRSVRSFVVVIACVMAPLSLSAHNGGSVVVGPIGASAPALGMPLLAILAMLLTVTAVVFLRRPRSVLSHALVVLALMLTATVGLSLIPTVVVSGDECNEITQKSYDSSSPSVALLSECPNPIRIIELDLNCHHSDCEQAELPPTSCEVGLVLNPGQICQLPTCGPC